MRQFMLINNCTRVSGGSLGIFFSNGLVGSIMVLGLIALFWPLIQNAWTRMRLATAA